MICLYVVVFMACVLSFTGGARAREPALSLDAAVSEAIHNNTLIRQAIEKQRAAMENEKSAAADLLPKLSVEYTYAHFKDKPYLLFDIPPLGSTKFDTWKQDRFAWDVSVTQPLFTGFALMTRRRIAELGIRMADIKKEQAVQDVILHASVGYFNILLAEHYLETADESVNQLEGHAKDATLFYDQEIIPENDLLKSRVALAHARQNRVTAASRLNVAVAALNIILNRDITIKTRIKDVPWHAPAGLELPVLFKRAMAQRPELKALETAVCQAAQAVRMEKSNYYPKVYLTGRYEQVGDNIRATNNEFGNSHNTIIGAQARWPFFEWGKTRADVNKAFHDMKALEAKIDGIRDSIRLEVKDAYEKLMVANENIKTAETALAQAKENFRITNLQYRQQVTTSTEVLDARSFLTRAEMNYYNARYGYMIAKAALDRAVGSNDVCRADTLR
ncbi:MAG: TolC family protein [Deltaproteobacteria bacterium]|nr:TolC family protein [Deltaproteobacteria bacterium]